MILTFLYLFYNIEWPLMLPSILLSVLLLHASFALILPPHSNLNAPHTAILFIPASGIDNDSYLPLMEELQAHHPSPLWIGLAESTS